MRVTLIRMVMRKVTNRRFSGRGSNGDSNDGIFFFWLASTVVLMIILTVMVIVLLMATIGLILHATVACQCPNGVLHRQLC